jgi:hypothetical protein
MTEFREAANSAAKGGLLGFAAFALFVFYVEWFDAHHIINCSNEPGVVTALARWDWVKSWIFLVRCE